MKGSKIAMACTFIVVNASVFLNVGCSGVSDETCSDERGEGSLGDRRCSSSSVIEECQAVAGGEPAWTESDTCVFDDGEVCFEGACIDLCEDECRSGSTSCRGDLLHECEQNMETGCTVWVSMDIGCED